MIFKKSEFKHFPFCLKYAESLKVASPNSRKACLDYTEKKNDNQKKCGEEQRYFNSRVH